MYLTNVWLRLCVRSSDFFCGCYLCQIHSLLGPNYIFMLKEDGHLSPSVGVLSLKAEYLTGIIEKGCKLLRQRSIFLWRPLLFRNPETDVGHFYLNRIFVSNYMRVECIDVDPNEDNVLNLIKMDSVEWCWQLRSYCTIQHNKSIH